MRGQINRIRETIDKVLKEDTTLGQKLKTLFREQGITIVGVFTAIGMIIGVFVKSINPNGTTSVSTITKPSSQGDVKDWINNQLLI